jgi:hypothetical protein
MYKGTPFRVPPLANNIIMVDRADGTHWQLTHRQSDDRFAIRDDPLHPTLRGQLSFFGPYEGPYLQVAFDLVRLLIRDGRIGYEMVTGRETYDSARVLTRRGPEKTYALEVIPAGWAREGDVLGWTVARGTPSL